MSDQLKEHFPNLNNIDSKKTSEIDPRYNCIAWAFEDNRRWWWPNTRGLYWPSKDESTSVADAFTKLFSTLGWEECLSSEPEEGYKKIALYEKNGEPTHAARLLPSGYWTSKLGQNIDLSHNLKDLSDGFYGKAAKIYKKPI